ncbi:MAG TPA: hypothetical protein VEA16_00040, partial [Vicinamibacterales bacterium]|nr:hypothetical protein [Vicinamibacterales bacterium]
MVVAFAEEVGFQPMAQFMNQRRLLGVWKVARAQTHRALAVARLPGTFENDRLDFVSVEFQPGNGLHRVHDPFTLASPQLRIF